MEHPAYIRRLRVPDADGHPQLGGLPPDLQAREVHAPVGQAGDHRRSTPVMRSTASEPEPSTLVTILHRLGSRVPSSEAEVATLKADLIRAGFRSENALPVFYGVRIVVTLVMLVLCIMMESKMPPNPVMKLGLMASGIGAGWVLPRFFLEKKVTKRAGDPAPLAARRAGSAGGFGRGRTRPGPGDPARGPRTARKPSAIERRNVAGDARNARRQAAQRCAAQLRRTHGRGGVPQAGRDSDSERPLRHQHGRIPAHAFRLSCACAAARKPKSAPARSA